MVRIAAMKASKRYYVENLEVNDWKSERKGF